MGGVRQLNAKERRLVNIHEHEHAIDLERLRIEYFDYAGQLYVEPVSQI